jgi:hypothetical protein
MNSEYLSSLTEDQAKRLLPSYIGVLQTMLAEVHEKLAIAKREISEQKEVEAEIREILGNGGEGEFYPCCGCKRFLPDELTFYYCSSDNCVNVNRSGSTLFFCKRCMPPRSQCHICKTFVCDECYKTLSCCEDPDY